MKRQDQISKRRAAERFEQWAKSNPVPIQLTFPTAGIAKLAQHSPGDLVRSVGKIFIETVMESEVGTLVGMRSQPNTDRDAYRWGMEKGYCVVDGQKIPIDRSLAEGLEETLTVLDLRLTPRRRQTLSSTNAIESSFSVAGKICMQVKRWQGSDHRLRRAASA